MAVIASFGIETLQANTERQQAIREARTGVKRLAKPTADSGKAPKKAPAKKAVDTSK